MSKNGIFSKIHLRTKIISKKINKKPIKLMISTRDEGESAACYSKLSKVSESSKSSKIKKKFETHPHTSTLVDATDVST